MSELEEKGSPRQSELIKTMENLIDTGLDNGKKLDKILKAKLKQNDSDVKHRRSSMKTTMIQMGLAASALYLGIIDVNHDNPIVSTITNAISTLLGYAS